MQTRFYVSSSRLTVSWMLCSPGSRSFNKPTFLPSGVNLAKNNVEYRPTTRVDSLEELERCIRGDDNAVDWKCFAAQAKPPPAIRLGREHPSISHADALRAGEAGAPQWKAWDDPGCWRQGTRLGFRLNRRACSKSVHYPTGLCLLMHVDRLRLS